MVISATCQQLKGGHPQIHMYQAHRLVSTRRGVTNQKRYYLSTLHHEMGHVFGLGDTYIEQGNDTYWHHNESEGGNSKTVGRQPLSVMNSSYLLALNEDLQLQLGEDDIAGIKWLYKYFITKNIDVDDCPADYLFENSTKGCRPRYPLIFAIKQNDWDTAKVILDNRHDDPTTNINQQDELGNSALHYAANAHSLHGNFLYNRLIEYGANQELRNKRGKIANDLLSIKTR